MSEQQRGIFIVLEGGDGTGKSTQAMIIADNTASRLVREPGGTAIGEKIRNILIDPGGPERDPIIDTFLTAASRAHLADTVIRPNLSSGQDVLSERSWMSSYAYQGASGASKQMIVEINQMAMVDLFKPDLVILLDADPEQAHARLVDNGNVADFYESKGIEYHKAVRELLLEVCELQDGVVIDAMQPIDDVTSQIMQAYKSRFEL